MKERIVNLMVARQAYMPRQVSFGMKPIASLIFVVGILLFVGVLGDFLYALQESAPKTKINWYFLYFLSDQIVLPLSLIWIVAGLLTARPFGYIKPKKLPKGMPLYFQRLFNPYFYRVNIPSKVLPRVVRVLPLDIKEAETFYRVFSEEGEIQVFYYDGQNLLQSDWNMIPFTKEKTD